MFLSGAIAVARELASGLAILALGLAVVFLGVGLWRARARVPITRAIQVQLAASWVAAALVIWLLVGVGVLGAEDEPNPWPYLALFPIMMLWFRWLGSRPSAR